MRNQWDMEFVEPIRDVDKINEIKTYLRDKKQREYAIFMLSINTGIKVGALLNLKLVNVFQNGKIVDSLVFEDIGVEYILNESVKDALLRYISTRSIAETHIDDSPLFISQKGGTPTEKAIYFSMADVFKEVGMDEGHYGLQSLPKTFGYHAILQGIDTTLLLKIFNKKQPKILYEYLGISEDERKNTKVIMLNW